MATQVKGSKSSKAKTGKAVNTTIASAILKKKVKRYGTFASYRGWTLKELDQLVKDSDINEDGIDAQVGDCAAGARIIQDLIAEIRMLKARD